MIFLQLFYSFFLIGLIGFGGGPALIGIIQSQVVIQHPWMSMTEFTNIVGVSQMTPGPIGINAATYVGYTAVVNAGYPQWMGVMGSVMTTVALMLPTFLIMLAISRLIYRHRNHPIVRHVFQVVRLAVVGILAAAALSMVTPENFGHPGINLHFVVSTSLMVITFVTVRKYKANIIAMILFAGLIGGIVYGL